MDGQSCIGMHNHGGSMAGGYEILYLWCRLKHALSQIPESSEDFLRRLSKQKRLKFEHLDQDYSVVKTKSGHYHLATKDVKQKLRALRAVADPDDWDDQAQLDLLQQELDSRRGPSGPSRYQDGDSDSEDNRRGYQRGDSDSDDDYDDYDDYQPQSALHSGHPSVFQGEDQRPVMAPSRPARQEPRPRSSSRRVAFQSSTTSAPPQPTNPQPSTSQQRPSSSQLPSILRATLRQGGLSRREAQRMSAELLARLRERLQRPSSNTAQQTPRPAPRERASTNN